MHGLAQPREIAFGNFQPKTWLGRPLAGTGEQLIRGRSGGASTDLTV